MSFGTYEPLSIMKSDWPIDSTLTKIGIPAVPLPISSIKRNQLFVSVNICNLHVYIQTLRTSSL